jgi:hypothetical protein
MQPIALIRFVKLLETESYKKITAEMRSLIALPKSCASFIQESVQLQQCWSLSLAHPLYHYYCKNKDHSTINSRTYQKSINNSQNHFIKQTVVVLNDSFVPNPPT